MFFSRQLAEHSLEKKYFNNIFTLKTILNIRPQKGKECTNTQRNEYKHRVKYLGCILILVEIYFYE